MFDSRWELRQAIRLGESTFLGLREVPFAGGMVRGPDRRDLADELAAFANTRGGVCVLGVRERSREIVGIPEDRVGRVVALVREVCADSVELNRPSNPWSTRFGFPRALERRSGS